MPALARLVISIFVRKNAKDYSVRQLGCLSYVQDLIGKRQGADLGIMQLRSTL